MWLLLIRLWLLPQEIATTDRLRWDSAADHARWWRVQGRVATVPLAGWWPDPHAAGWKKQQGDHEGGEERQTAASLDGVADCGHIGVMRAARRGVALIMEMRTLVVPLVVVNDAITRVQEELKQCVWVWVIGAGAHLHREHEEPDQGESLQQARHPGGSAPGSSSGGEE
jgi:hypothetical protein